MKNKQKLLSFVLDLLSFKDSDDEEQGGIFSQVKIYRTTSVKVFEFIVGILILAIWLLTIRNIIHATPDQRLDCLVVGVIGTFMCVGALSHSYHPTAYDLPFVKIVNARQVHYLSLCYRLHSIVFALFFLWVNCAYLIESEAIFNGGMITCVTLLFLNCIFFIYKIRKLRDLVEAEDPLPAIRNEKLLTIGTFVLSIAIGFGVHCLPFWGSIPSLLRGVLKGIVAIAVIVGIIWIGQRFFGLFREINKEEPNTPGKQ